MKVYFGGVDAPNHINALVAAGGKRIMISYASPPTKNTWKMIEEHGLEVMADSGAFSIWKRGAELDICAYMQWIDEHNIKLYYNMDIVGDWQNTAENQKYMEDNGYKPIPVFHMGEPWEVLDRMVNDYELIGLGGTVGSSYGRKVTWFRQVFSRHPDGKFHALGVARESIIRQFPLESTDSVWWIFKWRKNEKIYSDTGIRRDEQVARVKYLQALESVPRAYQQSWGW